MTPVEGQKPPPNQVRIIHNGVEIAPTELPLQVCASQGIEIRDFESQIEFDDGSFIYEIGNAKPLLDENGQPRGAVGAFMDITGLKHVEEELRRRAEELDALQKTVLDITTAQSLPDLLESIVERACQLVGAPGGGLYQTDLVKQEVRCDVSFNTPANYIGVVLKYGEGVAGKVAQTGKPFLIDDYKSWAGRAHNFEVEKPFSTVLGVPLLWGGQVNGVIDVLHYEEGKTFTQADMDLLNIFAGHAAIAIENGRLLEASQAGEAEVRALSARLADAEENERRRIARELHDQVGQSLSALSINMNIMSSQVPQYLPGFKRRLDDSLMLIDQTTDHIRNLMSELRPAVLDDYGLKAALDWAAGSVTSRTNLKLLVEGECNRFPPRVEIALFRIAQEALGNISRHASARNVKILVTQDGPDMSMSITDDGVGFDPSAVAATDKSGWGLRLMAERAESIGARLQVESSHGKGTTITARYHDKNSTSG
jgi:signal transduction histidine kinase